MIIFTAGSNLPHNFRRGQRASNHTTFSENHTMDKKDIYGLLDEIIANVASNNQLNEVEARTFVGVALRRGKEAFLKTVIVPQLTVAEPRNDAE